MSDPTFVLTTDLTTDRGLSGCTHCRIQAHRAPAQEERTETSISLRLLKPQAPLRQHMVLSLELRAHGDGAWREAVADAPAAVVTVSGLQPGTKYVFRSRGGMEDPDGRLVCGEYSAESVYPTLGNPPSTGGGAAAAAAAPSGGQQGRRKGGKGPKAAKAASTTGAEPQRQTSAAAQEAEREVRCTHMRLQFCAFAPCRLWDLHTVDKYFAECRFDVPASICSSSGKHERNKPVSEEHTPF